MPSVNGFGSLSSTFKVGSCDYMLLGDQDYLVQDDNRFMALRDAHLFERLSLVYCRLY